MAEATKLVCWRETHQNTFDAEEFGTAIVWAEDEAGAIEEIRKYYAREVGDYDPCGVKRAPEFDRFAPAGPIPIADFVAAGWWITCFRCGRTIEEEMELYDDESEQPIPVGTDVAPFCCQKCYDEALAAQQRAREQKEQRGKKPE